MIMSAICVSVFTMSILKAIESGDDEKIRHTSHDHAVPQI